MQREPMNTLVTRRSFVKGIGLLGVSAALAGCSQAAGSKSSRSASESAASSTSPAASSSASSAAAPLLAIIHTNDTHGHDVAVAGHGDEKGNFSMAAVAALKHEWEQKGYDVLLVDAGDATQGMPLVNDSKGATAIEFMNACGYDLMAVGNHEYDWGTEALAANERAANFPFLSANIVDVQTGKPRFVPNKTFDLSGGIKIGFFGLTTPSTSTVSDPKNATDVRILRKEELYACAQTQVDELRGQGCAIVACLGHIGNKRKSSNTSRSLIENVDGIDLFIDGHDHKEVSEMVGNTLLVETGCHLHNIGIVVIDQESFAPELVPAGSYDGIDDSVQVIIDSENESLG